MADGKDDAVTLLRPGRNIWQKARAKRAAVIVDADAYFRAARAAMLSAKRRIMLIGWDFDARIALVADPDDGAPKALGDFIVHLVEQNPELDVYLLRWDLGALKTLLRGTTIVTLLRWLKHPRIHVRLDGAHPVGASHHQKIAVIDDCLAFCGGIDMTGDRWDTRDHRDDDPGRVEPNGKPYKPWHDATTALEGDVARVLGDLARDRWQAAGGAALERVDVANPCWPEGLEVDFAEVEVAVSRSYPEHGERTPVREIEALYLDLIADARRFIYAESQYFASRRIAEAIARRLDEIDGPEVVIVNPHTAEGWLEPVAMDTARARLIEALRRRDKRGALKVYHPVTAGGAPIYVHAKILVIDDRLIRVGSSNMNNRSLRLDTECDVTIAADEATDPRAARERIATIRDELLAEHLGVSRAAVTAKLDETRSLIATIEALRGEGKTLVPYEVPDLNAVEAWLADNEVLDPEGPEEMFETLTRRGLFRGFRLKLPRAQGARGAVTAGQADPSACFSTLPEAVRGRVSRKRKRRGTL